MATTLAFVALFVIFIFVIPGAFWVLEHRRARS